MRDKLDLNIDSSFNINAVFVVASAVSSSKATKKEKAKGMFDLAVNSISCCHADPYQGRD